MIEPEHYIYDHRNQTSGYLGQEKLQMGTSQPFWGDGKVLYLDCGIGYTGTHFVKAHWPMHFKLVCFLCELYVNKVDVLKETNLYKLNPRNF